MKKSEALFGIARVPLDALAVGVALLLAYRLREAGIDLLPGIQLLENAKTLPPFPYYLRATVLPGIALFLMLAAFVRLYALRATLSLWIEVGRILIVTGLWLVCVIAWYFLVLKQLFFSRALLLHALFFMFFFSAMLRVSLRLLQRSLLRAGIGRMLVVSVGAQMLVDHAKEIVEKDRHYAYLGHLKNLSQLQEITQKEKRIVDLVIHTDPNPQSQDTFALIDYCRSHHFGYAFLPPVLADVPHQLAVERLGLLPLIRFQPTPLDGWGRIVKRLFDVVGSLLLLIILSPLLLLCALGVLIDSGWPVFYVSKRVGQHGREMVKLWKFRSMIKNADEEKEKLKKLNHRKDGPLFKVKNDPRVTRFGSFLRRFSLDELPQLWNVFTGRLSLVGPRPHLPEEVELYTPEQRRVFAVKPGVTGLAQVSGRSDLSFQEETALDLQYIEEWSIFLDLWILWRTVFVVMSRKGAD
jgi:exopolysaccharide biosynthesis polyprenyl glycosylphosphotransferase